MGLGAPRALHDHEDFSADRKPFVIMKTENPLHPEGLQGPEGRAGGSGDRRRGRDGVGNAGVGGSGAGGVPRGVGVGGGGTTGRSG